MENNAHIIQYLDEYISDKNENPRFAILLKGNWGSGKTYFIKNYIKKNENKFVYISLYGSKSTSEIDDLLFQEFYPLLASKGWEITGKIVKGLIKLSTKIDLDNDGDKETLTCGIPNIEIQKYLNKFDGKVIVFDDLERCNIDMTDLLGYVNYFVEHNKRKVVLVANDDEIESEIKDEEKKIKSKFHKIKEKVIGASFEVNTDTEKVLPILIEENCDKSKEIVLNNIQYYLERLKIITSKPNFRIIQHSLRNFEYVWKHCLHKYTDKNDLVIKLIINHLTISYEINKGDIKRDDFVNIEDIAYKTATKNLYNNKEDKSIKKTDLEIFYEKYRLDNYNSVLTINDWILIICDNKIEIDKIWSTIDNSRYLSKENMQIWEKLVSFPTVMDDDVEPLFREVETEINNKRIVEPGQILHIFGMILWLNERKIILSESVGTNISEIIKNAKKYINEISEKWDFQNTKLIIRDLERSYGGKKYANNESKEFVDIKKHLFEKMSDNRIMQLIAKKGSLLEIMVEDPMKFCQSIINTPVEVELSFWEIPIFYHIKPQVFIDHFNKIRNDNTNKYDIPSAFIQRYKELEHEGDYYNYLKPELAKELNFHKQCENIINKHLSTRSKIMPSDLYLKTLLNNGISQSIKIIENYNNKIR